MKSGRSSLGGHKVYFDESNMLWKYENNDEKIDADNERPCIECGHKPTDMDDDYCIGHLGNVINACCGHGTSEGYIQFDNGIIIRGYFRVEKY